MSENGGTYREFTVTGRIYCDDETDPKYEVFCALRQNEAYDDLLLIDEILIENGESK